MSKRVRINQFSQEEQNLYYDILHAHTVEDVLSKYECDEETASDVAEQTRLNINRCEHYFYEYWSCVELAAKESKLSLNHNHT